MGSATSRGKKVAPACVGQVTSIKASCKPLKRPLQPPKIHAILRNARKCAQLDRHSEGHDSGSSGEDNDGERDTVPERRGWVSERTSLAKKSSKTYGLCHSRRDGEEDSGPEESHAPGGANKRKNTAFPKHQLKSSSRGVLTTEVLLKDVARPHKQPTFGGCNSSPLPLPMPIILYDGSEEELMDTIEREFS